MIDPERVAEIVQTRGKRKLRDGTVAQDAHFFISDKSDKESDLIPPRLTSLTDTRISFEDIAKVKE